MTAAAADDNNNNPDAVNLKAFFLSQWYSTEPNPIPTTDLPTVAERVAL